MNLYLLTLTETAQDRIPSYSDWYSGHVIAADTPREARNLAAASTDDVSRHRYADWLKPSDAKLENLGHYDGGKLHPFIILSEGRFH
jgi:hypothetical protein